MTLVAAARKRREPLHHLLLCGRSGMGKATLAKIAAGEMGVGLKTTSGMAIEKAGDIAAILTNLRTGDMLVIEQIETMPKQVSNALIAAITDLSLEVVIGKGPSARNIRLRLPSFTLVGLTSRPLQLNEHLSNLMYALSFAPYDKVDLSRIVSLSAIQQGITIDSEASELLAEQSNGRPGEALLTLKKVHEYAVAYADGRVTSAIARSALAVFGPNDEPTVFERQSVPADVKMFVWQRDGGRCAKCGSQEKLEYDHIIPVSKGGSNTARNIELLCEKCNRSKSASIV